MTNDTTTLNGSLRELGELMATNLTEQGVASTYDEGLTTLANKILDIQGGGTTQTLTLTSDKSILSYSDEEQATLTATLIGGSVSGKTVTFKADGVSIGSDTTDATGNATLTYTSQGVGDVSLTASVGSLTSETLSIRNLEKVYYQNDGTRNDLVCASGTSVTVENGALKVTSSSSGEKKFYFPSSIKFTSSENVCMEFECARETETGQIIGLSLINSVSSASLGYCAYNTSDSETGGAWYCSFNNDSYSHNIQLNKGDIIKLVRENGYTKLYHNDTLIRSVSRSVSYYFGGYTNLNRVQRFKNIVIYKL